MRIAPPFRFLLLVLGAWVGARTLMLLPRAAARVIPVITGVGRAEAATPVVPRRFVSAAAFTRLAPAAPPTASAIPMLAATEAGPSIAERMSRRAAYAAPADGMAFGAAGTLDLPRPNEPAAVFAPTRADKRWSLSAWLYARDGGGAPALAGGGQLGGGQAGVRATYRLNASGPTRLALAARVSTPIANTRGAEAAVGLDWHPVPSAPIRLSVERRVDLGGEGRDAWSAYAAGGFYKGGLLKGLAGGLEADGYAQAGVVGAERRDLFADGALRVSKAIAIEKATLRVGAGVWGAAQPGVSRVEVGPRTALTLPVGQGDSAGTITAALEYRVRVAGNARPGSGPAFTLSADF